MSIDQFEIEDLRFVGYVKYLLHSARIDVLGYMKGHNIYALSPEEVKQFFPPEGDVFAYNFELRYAPGSCRFISFCVKDSNKFDLDDDKCKYEIDYNRNIDINVGEPLKVLPITPTDDGDFNYALFETHGTFNYSYPLFIRSGERVFHYKPGSNSRLLDWWNISNVDILSSHGYKIVVNNGGNHPYDGQIDLTTDEQLITWFFNKIIEPKWDEIWAEGKFNDVNAEIRKVFEGVKSLPLSIIESRFSRLVKLTKAFNLESDKIKAIANAAWLKNSIDKTIDDKKEIFFKEFSAEMSAELTALEDSHKKEIDNRNDQLHREYNRINGEHQERIKGLERKITDKEQELQDAQSKLEAINKEIAEKRAESEHIETIIKEAQERKDDIIKDFSVIKDVLGIGSMATQVVENKTVVIKHTIESVDLSNDLMPKYKVFEKALENNIKYNGIKYHNDLNKNDDVGLPKIIAGSLYNNNIVLLPHASLVNIILYATSKCKYIIEPVCVNWKSFDDLWVNGLADIVSVSNNEPDIMHYLVLQNINMSYLPTYMQPLINMQNGISTYFPYTQIEFPQNLRILCTITNEEVIPLNKQCLSYIGCITKDCVESGSKINPYKEKIYGYLNPNLLNDVSLAEDYPQVNNYQTYMDE